MRDRAIVARAGGDEFIIVRAGSEPLLAKSLADAIITSFREPFDIPGATRELLGVSIGVAFYPRDRRDGEALLKAAHADLYRMKRSGRDSSSGLKQAVSV